MGRIFLLLQLLHLAVSFKTDCPYACISVAECSELRLLIKTNPTAVREATCSFDGIMPQVCCPSESSPTDPTTPPPPTLKPPVIKTNLLPQDCGQHSLGEKLVGGKMTRLGDYPWMAALGYKNSFNDKTEFLCGGSVINKRYVLTAAHCVNPKQPEVIRLGEWDFNTDLDCEESTFIKACAPQPAQDYLFEEIVIHPDYNKRAKVSDDIALIRLMEPINFRNNAWVQPVCLPDVGFDVRSAGVGRDAKVTGWGLTENGSVSDVLLEVSLPFVDMKTCNETYKGRLLKEQICFGGEAGKDSCGGDSGGPLIMLKSSIPPYYQTGIVSFGPRDCGRQGVPGVYTNVANYRRWIEQNLRE